MVKCLHYVTLFRPDIHGINSSVILSLQLIQVCQLKGNATDSMEV